MREKPIYESLTYDGLSSLSFGVRISGDETYKSPERDVERIEIPGRNGDLTIDRNRFKSYEQSYSCFLVDDFDHNLSNFKAFLLSTSKFRRLEDTYHPDEFRMAQYIGPLEPEVFFNEAGQFSLKFWCKPERWLKSGEEVVTLTKNGTIKNPTFNISKPLIRIYGKGEIKIGNSVISVLKSGNRYIDFDCDTFNAFEGLDNRNSHLKIIGSPFLHQGENGILIGDGVSKIEIKPRWWVV